LSLSENARLFALLSMASADSQIIAFAEKYNRPHWRPITAIRTATDLNIATLKVRYWVGAASGDAAASRIPFRPCDVFRRRGSCSARFLRR
jgi:hypothetical protein